MGQLVGVVEKPSASPGVVRFEVNRTLSGSGHERFRSIADAHGNTPSDELARRMFGTGQVAAMHVYSNIITVDLAKGFDSTGLADLVQDLYTYWRPGVEPPSLEELQPAEPETPAGGDAGGGGGAELSELAKKVPPHLLERGRAARAKWNAR